MMMLAIVDGGEHFAQISGANNRVLLKASQASAVASFTPWDECWDSAFLFAPSNSSAYNWRYVRRLSNITTTFSGGVMRLVALADQESAVAYEHSDTDLGVLNYRSKTLKKNKGFKARATFKITNANAAHVEIIKILYHQQ